MPILNNIRFAIFFVCMSIFVQEFSCRRSQNEDEKGEEPKLVLNGSATEHTFYTDVDSKVKVLWMGGENSSEILICTVNTKMSKSSLFRSTNGGENFTNMTELLQSHAVIRAVKSTTDNEKVILILNSTGSTLNQTIMMSSNNSGATFVGPKAQPFFLKNTFIFHPSNGNLLLALGLDNGNCNAYVSKDFGREWQQLQESVIDAIWSPTENDGIYLLKEVGEQKNDSVGAYELVLRSVSDATVKILMQNVVSFLAQDKFLYAAVKDEKSSAITLKVSTSSGRIWNNAQFVPEKKGQVYCILDTRDGMVFLFVGSDSSIKKGTPGVIYSSDQDGIVFTESLTNAAVIHGKEYKFYKVLSMDGVYLSQQSNNGTDSYSVITFNRGRNWQKINFPEECHKAQNSCKTLLITYDSVEDMSIKPLSFTSYYKLPIIVVHVRAGTQRSVYLSLDGGNTWKQTLSEPHFLGIANQGALLVAASPVYGVDSIKYSANEGQLWQSLGLKESMVVTNLLTQPNSWTSKVVVVSRNQQQTKWIVSIVSFSAVVGKQHCTDKDFDSVTSHGFYANNGTDRDCILGVKEEFKKMKNSSWCLLKDSLLTKGKSSVRTYCPCSPEDYECDFGFYRASNGSVCIENPELVGKFLDVCNSTECPATETSRYRKIPGSMCSKGWDPGVQFGTVVRQKYLSKNSLTSVDNKMKNVVIAVIVMLVVVIVFTMVVYFIRKLQQLNKQEPTYRYSKLNQDEMGRGVTSDDDSQETLVDISSEDEGSAPATLLVHSQTVSPVSNGSALNSIPAYKTTQLPEASIKSLLEDDDDELLQ